MSKCQSTWWNLYTIHTSLLREYFDPDLPNMPWNGTLHEKSNTSKSFEPTRIFFVEKPSPMREDCPRAIIGGNPMKMMEHVGTPSPSRVGKKTIVKMMWKKIHNP